MADDEENDPTAPFNELEAFDSLFQALKWKQIKKRIPICFKKTLSNRYFFANFVYLVSRDFIQSIEIEKKCEFQSVLCHWYYGYRFSSTTRWWMGFHRM